MDLLDLPPELVLACLAQLSLSDIRSCLAARNRLFSVIILTSAAIRYRFEQEHAGVVANAHRSPQPPASDGLRELRAREANWLHFTPSSRHTTPFGFPTASIYDLAADVYLVGDVADPSTSLCTTIKYISTDPGSSWVRIEVGKPIVDFGTALEEHDLIAMVTYTRHPDDAEMAALEVVLLQFSTGARHPLAAIPILHVHDVDVDRGRPAISIEIVGAVLAISVLYWMDPRRDRDSLHLFYWQTGVRPLDPLMVSNIGLTFLTPEILLVPSALDQMIDVFRIPQPPSDDDVFSGPYHPSFVRSLHLPQLNPNKHILSFQCRGEPNPRTRLVRPTTTPFLSTPEDSIILFSVDIGDGEGRSSTHMFVVSRARLAAFLASQEALEAERRRRLEEADDDSDDEYDVDTDLNWAEWGVRCARWLDDAGAGTWARGYITTTCGSRMVAIAHDAWSRPAPIRVLDFNQRRVERVRDGAANSRVRVVDADAGTVPHQPHVFAEPLTSSLPYIETVSEETFPYAAVLINNSDIIGVKLNVNGDQDVGSLEVLRLG
ncbi:hypothetical protein FB45DRAFT_1001390 [Roridomyces roridus]|uniref:F-box domain-containing protein n=1 Tax=Roridomyces roridus TaxID=1738132 RepID=A0AAD7C0E9_9AGAR|nr:hypothetical protein FB45DRAFT_1001390 [Roridomyces roridus]